MKKNQGGPAVRSESQKPKKQGRVYTPTQYNVQASNLVVTGALSISTEFARVLFDSGSTLM